MEHTMLPPITSSGYASYVGRPIFSPGFDRKQPKGSSCGTGSALGGRAGLGGQGEINAPLLTSIWYAASNVSGIMRNWLWIQNRVSPDPGATQGFGLTGAAGVLTGPLGIHGGLDDLSTAQKVSDLAGQRFAQMRVARGVIDTVGGFTAAGMRTMNLASLSTTSKTVATAGMVLGYMATGLSTLSLGIKVVQFAITAHGARSALLELTAAKDDQERMEILLSKYLLTKDDFEAAKENLSTEEDIEITQEELGALTELEKLCANDEKLPEGDHIRVKYWKNLICRKLAKEAEYKRAIGPESLKMIRNACRTDTLSQNEGAIVAEARNEARFAMLLNGLFFAAGFVGVVSFVMTAALTGGMGLLVGYWLMMVMNVVLTGGDIYCLCKDLEALKRGVTKEDMVIMLFFMFITIGSTVTGVLFATTLPMLISVVVGGSMMFVLQSLLMYYSAEIPDTLIQNLRTKHLSEELAATVPTA